MIGLRRKKAATELPTGKGTAAQTSPGNEAGQSSANDARPAGKPLPHHVAVIMDGNGRWAKSRGLPRAEGHRAGTKTVRMVVEECRRLGIRYLTLFCFSSENWSRPEQEVSALMKLFLEAVKSEAKKLRQNNIRLRAIGDLDKLPAAVRRALEQVIADTECDAELDLILALSYGGRDEILQMVQRIAQAAKEGRLEPQEISAETVRSYMYAPDVPDPDLLIRTSAEHRISNFLLWQLAYAEIVVSKLCWPEFSQEEFHRCLTEYQGRDRRFGLVAEQLKEET